MAAKQFSSYQANMKDKSRILENKLRHFVSDAIAGDYNRETKNHAPGTGRPWLQKQRITIDGIDGWALIDGFDFLGMKFTKLSPRDVVSAVINHRGLFATTANLRWSNFGPAYMTHHVLTFDTLDRLKYDTAWMFDLSLILTSQEDGIHRAIMPQCRIDSEVQAAVDNDHPCLYCRIGTENDFRKIIEYGFKPDDNEIFMIGKASEFEKENVAGLIQDAVRDYVTVSFDSGYHWNVPAEMEAAVETMFDGPENHDDDMEEEDEMIEQITDDKQLSLFDTEASFQIDTTIAANVS